MKNVISLQPFYLAQPLGATDVTMQVRGLKDSRGNLITSMPSGVTELTITIEPRSTTNQEFVSGTGITDNGNGLVTITGLTRNLSPVDGSADLSDTVSHANNSECVISNSPYSMRNVLMTNEDKTVTGTLSFATSPTVPTATSATQAVNKSQLDLAVLGTVPASSTTVLGAVRVATDPTKTLGTATMTIASPCVVTLNSHGLTANDTIRFTTTGTLPTGLVVNTTYYVISTGLTVNTFQLSLTAGGTAINTSGSQSGTHTLYRTTPYAINDQDTRLPTQAENDAMAGTSGNAVSGTNKFVDNDDTLGTGKVLRASSVVATAFGTGVDGALTYDGAATILGMAPAASVYTLTRDIYGSTIVINGGVTIETAGYRIFASTSLTNAGTIKRTPNVGGNAASLVAGTAASALASGTIYGGLAGSSGGSGFNVGAGGSPTIGGAGNAGTAQTESIGVVGVAGGNGGISNLGNVGGAGGAGGTVTASPQHIYNVTFATILREFQGENTIKYIKGPSGSGGGGGGSIATGFAGSSGAGGGSGSTGGIVFIAAKVLTNSGTISALGGNGGNGGNAASGAAGGGGGGAGGAGGVVVLIYNSITLGTVTVTGGTGGTAGTGIGGGGSGVNGTTGTTGTIIQITA